VIGQVSPARRSPVSFAALAVPALAVPVLVGSLSVGSGTGGTDEQGDDMSAVALLYRAMEAPETVSYAGTQYVAAWSPLQGGASTSAVVDVTHRAGGPIEVRTHGSQPMSVVEDHSSAGWLAGGGGPVGLLVRAYEVTVVGFATVAGRPVHVVEARRADGSTAARLWLDTESALPLRREVYDEDGATRTASAFVEIDVETQVAPAISSLGRGESSARSLRRADLERLRGDGWSCPETLGDELALYEARRVGDAVQLSYSDGVVTVSVFEQPGRLDPTKLNGFAAREVEGGVVYSAPGPPATFTWSVDDWVVTVVADAPADTVDDVLAALPPREPEGHRGLVARVGKGAERLASWLNPFD
jgi:sigma-E factor negative regulatory protein RseB